MKETELKPRGEEKIDDKETLGLIKEFGELTAKRNLIREKLHKIYPFDELMDWDATGVYGGCTVKDGSLYDSCGELLSEDGRCMNEEIPYFVNQHTGYCEDDYYGTMFIKVVNENTFVAIHYWC